MYSILSTVQPRVPSTLLYQLDRTVHTYIYCDLFFFFFSFPTFLEGRRGPATAIAARPDDSLLSLLSAPSGTPAAYSTEYGTYSTYDTPAALLHLLLPIVHCP